MATTRTVIPADLAAASVTRRVGPGEVITRQGESVSCLQLVSAGAVRLTAVSPAGRQVVVGVLGPGDIFGERALLDGGPSPVEARALQGSNVLSIPVAAIDAVVDRNPGTATELLRLIAARLHRTSEALEETMLLDVGARVARRLARFAGDHGEPGPAGVTVSITQEELARMVGASRESVNRALASFSARGLLRTGGGRITVRDVGELGREVG
jgi:CRP/FNR family transcriptional regulator, cyclic AMP receptor protein